MSNERYPSPEEAEIQRIREEIDEWESGTSNFYVYLIPDEQLEGILAMSRPHGSDAMAQMAEKRVGKEGSKYEDIIEAITEFSESEEWSSQFEHITHAEQFTQAKEAVIYYEQLPFLSREKGDYGVQLEEETLKPLLKEMVPVLLKHNVNPRDLTA